MILKDEIQRIATAKKIGIDIVEKDYILSWVLAGIHHHEANGGVSYLKPNNPQYPLSSIEK